MSTLSNTVRILMGAIFHHGGSRDLYLGLAFHHVAKHTLDEEAHLISSVQYVLDLPIHKSKTQFKKRLDVTSLHSETKVGEG